MDTRRSRQVFCFIAVIVATVDVVAAVDVDDAVVGVDDVVIIFIVAKADIVAAADVADTVSVLRGKRRTQPDRGGEQ